MRRRVQSIGVLTLVGALFVSLMACGAREPGGKEDSCAEGMSVMSSATTDTGVSSTTVESGAGSSSESVSATTGNIQMTRHRLSITGSTTAETVRKDTATLTTTTTARTNRPLTEGERIVTQYLTDNAYLAAENLLVNYWETDGESGHIISSSSQKVWCVTMSLLGFETMYRATGSQRYQRLILQQFDYWMTKYPYAWICGAGNGNNPIMDDAAWTAMGMYLCYDMGAGDTALSLAVDTVEQAYSYFAEGSDPGNGLYYSLIPGGDGYRVKSGYCVGLLYTALRLCEVLPESDRRAKLYADSLALYGWMEENLLRDGPQTYGSVVSDCSDGLYYCDFPEDAAGVGYPRYYETPTSNAATPMFTNMGMACIHKKLYDLTGDDEYLTRAVETANALAKRYSDMLINDRDAFTNTTFLGYFVSEVMPLEGVDKRLGAALYKTVYSIMENCYFESGYYGANWNVYANWGDGTHPINNPVMIMTSANTTRVLFAAALAAQMGLIDPDGVDLHLMDKGLQEQKLTAAILAVPEAAPWRKNRD